MLQQKAPGQEGRAALFRCLNKEERGFNIEEGPTREAFLRLGGLLQRLRIFKCKLGQEGNLNISSMLPL